MRSVAWSYCCLPCNAAWRGSHPHVHTDYQEYRRGFWAYRLRRCMPGETAETACNLVEYPIARSVLDGLLGREE